MHKYQSNDIIITLGVENLRYQFAPTSADPNVLKMKVWLCDGVYDTYLILHVGGICNVKIFIYDI